MSASACSGGHSPGLEASRDIAPSSAGTVCWPVCPSQSARWLLQPGQQGLEAPEESYLSLSALDASLKASGILFRAGGQISKRPAETKVEIKG